jgi:type II secretory ATPase GspE/PulE/Tfp pilus assembly ATPase PilB-like protein
MSTFFREGSLGSILYGSRMVTEDNIYAALEEQRRTGLRFGEALVRLGIVQEEDVDWALAHQLDIPFVRLRKETIDPDAVRLVTADLARKFALIPIIRIGDELRIAIADPTDGAAVAEVARATGCPVAISLGLLREIREMQSVFYGEPEEVHSAGFSSTCFTGDALTLINADPTGVGLLDHLLDYLCRNRLSSISVKSVQSRTTVSGRSGAASLQIGQLTTDLFRELLTVLKSKAGMSDDIPSAGTVTIVRNGVALPLSVLLSPTTAGEYLTIKAASGAAFPETLAGLQASEQHLGIIRDLAALPEGLVLIAAADPELRSCLMGAIMRELDGSGKDLLAIGRRFSYCADRIPVLTVDGDDRGESHLLRTALAHEPHVIALENLTDAPGYAAACEAVRSGTLLLGGVPASGIRAVLRQLMVLRERFPLIPLYLKGLIACREVALLCPECRKDGCPTCNGTGNGERRYLVEAVRVDGNFLDIFNRSADMSACLEYLREHGFSGILDEASGLLSGGLLAPVDYAAISAEHGENLWPE